MFRTVPSDGQETHWVARGDGALDGVLLRETGGSLRLTPAQQAQADRACERLREEGRTVTPDPIYRLLEWRAEERLELLVERANYAQVVGIKAHPEWGLSARALAVCCLTECRDGFVIEQRSARVASLPGRWHVAPAGSLQPPHHLAQTLRSEAREELGLEPHELVEPRCLGLLYGRASGIFQLACSVRTPLRLQEMLARERSGAWEQDGLLCAPASREALPLWLEQSPLLTPGAARILQAEGERRWGSDWPAAPSRGATC